MLKTKRIYLRKLEREDLERTHDWINRPDIYISMGTFGPRSKDEQKKWFDELISSRTNIVFALCRVSDDAHIGNLSLFDVNYVNRNAGLTIFIADEENRGDGIGKEAVQLICEYAFNYLNMHRVYCKTNNPIAGKMYEQLGFQHEGVRREQNFQRGKYVDKQLYGLLRSELKPVVDTSTD